MCNSFPPHPALAARFDVFSVQFWSKPSTAQRASEGRSSSLPLVAAGAPPFAAPAAPGLCRFAHRGGRRPSATLRAPARLGAVLPFGPELHLNKNTSSQRRRPAGGVVGIRPKERHTNDHLLLSGTQRAAVPRRGADGSSPDRASHPKGAP